MKPASSDEQTAYHEAGHYVAIHSLERHREVLEVTIVPEGDVAGAVKRRSGEIHTGDIAFEAMVIAQAGALAQTTRDPSCTPAALKGAVSDREHFNACVDALTQDPVERRALCDRAHSVAWTIVGTRWDAIRDLARALLRRKTLDGREARLIVEGRTKEFASHRKKKQADERRKANEAKS